MRKTYRELSLLPTFEERFEYLSLKGRVGDETFGHERHLNQRFYTSYQWRSTREFVIVRDEGRDLGIPGYEIGGQITVHHIMPMTPEDIVEGNPMILDPDNLISVSHQTHNAIHYGDQRFMAQPFTERRPGDTKSW